MRLSSCAMVASICKDRDDVAPERIKKALCGHIGVRLKDIKVSRHRPEDFLIVFTYPHGTAAPPSGQHAHLHQAVARWSLRRPLRPSTPCPPLPQRDLGARLERKHRQAGGRKGLRPRLRGLVLTAPRRHQGSLSLGLDVQSVRHPKGNVADLDREFSASALRRCPSKGMAGTHIQSPCLPRPRRVATGRIWPVHHPQAPLVIRRHRRQA